jgi:DNA-binding transcriptional regulator YhcF (GntR family)
MAGALRVSLDLDSPTPAYRQIANDLRRHLVDERLKPGDLLPPIRQLAVDLGVHFNTVALAYRMLADEGWLELKRRRGAAVIARNAPRAVDRRQVNHLLRQLAQIAAELRSAGMSAREISSALRRLAEGAQP